MGHLIKGKQLEPNSLLAKLLYTTGSTATDGQIPSFDISTSGFTWVDNTGGVTSVSGGTALDETSTTGDVVLDVRTDDLGIFVDGSNNLTLGDPNNNNLISGGDYIFDGSLTVNANFTVLGTATTVNTEHLYVEDNIITLNSTFTAGTPTLNAGLEVLRGDESAVEFRWNESNQWWEVTNPEGTGTTYSALLTTGSVESEPDTSTLLGVDIRQGTASDADKLFLGVSADSTTIVTTGGFLQVGTIGNANLTNDSVTVTAGAGLGGGGTVALGGSITLSATSTWTDVLSNGNASGGNDAIMTAGDVLKSSSGGGQLDLRAFGTDNYVALTSGFETFSGGSVYITPFQAGVYYSDSAQTEYNYFEAADTYSQILARRYGKYNGFVANADVGTGLTQDSVEMFSSGGTIYIGNYAGAEVQFALAPPVDNTVTHVMSFDGSGNVRRTVISSLSEDNYTTGTTLVGSTLYFDRTDSLSAYTADLSPLLDDTNFYTTGSTLIGDTAYFDRTDTLSAFTLDLSTLDVGDTYVTGGTITTAPSTSDENGAITLSYNNVEGGPYTLPFTDKFVISGIVSDTDLVLALNDGTTAVPIDLSSLDVNDTFSTGGTISYTNEAGTITINGNAGFTPYNITGITDVQTTGGTYAAGTITFTQNDGSTYNVTGLDSTDTYVSGGTVSSGSLSLDLNDASTVNVTGSIIQSVSGNSPITASTTNGAVSVGLDYSSLQLAVPTTSDKGLSASANTSGNAIIPGVTLNAPPVNGGQVNMTINSAYYVLGETTGDDIYFTTDGGTSAVAFASLTGGENIFWKGTTIGFDVETTDTINLHYNILQ